MTHAHWSVLVVEDNLGDSFLIREYLQEDLPEAEVTVVERLSETLELLEKGGPFDIILLDLTLPDAQGEPLAKAVVAAAGDRPVIVLTGLGDKEYGIRALSWGVADYLLKDGLTSEFLAKSIRFNSERNRYQLQLRDSERKYRDLFQLSPIPKWVYDLETLRFLDVNAAATRQYGFSRDEFLKLSLKDIRPASELPALLAAVEEVRKSPESPTSGLFRHKRKDGTLLWVEIRSNRIQFEGRDASMVLAVDKTAEVEYQEQLRLFESVITNSHEAVMITSAEASTPEGPPILYVNETFTRMTGFRLEEVRGRTPGFLHGPETDRAEIDRLNDAIANLLPCNLELVNYRKDRTPYWVDLFVAPVYNHDGVCTHWISVQRDITERRSYIDALESQNRRLREIAWFQSHKLRAPLVRMIGLLEMIETDHADQVPSLRTLLEQIGQSTAELDSVIHEIVQRTES